MALLAPLTTLQERLAPPARRVQAALARGGEGLRKMPPRLRRGLLYGALSVFVVFLHRSYVRLRDLAAAREALPPHVSFYDGELGGSKLREGLEESGSTPAEAKAVLKALAPLGGAQRRYSGDRYRFFRSPTGELQHVTISRGTDRIIVLPLPQGKFKAVRSKAPIQLVRHSAAGTVTRTLWPAMLRAGMGDEVIQKYVEVFQWTVDFLSETRDGDRFSLSWIERRTPDGRVWGRDVQAALYEGKAAGRNIGIFFDDAYYDAKGNSLQRMFLRAPLDFRHITSGFSMGRWHPILHARRPHLGVDYGAARGTPVRAIGEGRVAAASYAGGFGKHIEIKHNATYTSLYGHLDRYAAGIAPGVHVRQGQVIGYVGSTGLATGPHLHFQFSRDGKWVNFAALKLPKDKSIPQSRAQEFSAVRDHWLKELGVDPALAKSGESR
jgi:murein DD-endopeptidase MepM/ murein hydrolase activator NlpD